MSWKAQGQMILSQSAACDSAAQSLCVLALWGQERASEAMLGGNLHPSDTAFHTCWEALPEAPPKDSGAGHGREPGFEKLGYIS